MTPDQIIAELKAARVSEGPKDAYTTGEIADMMGLGLAAVRRRLKVLQKADRLMAVRVERPNLAGQMQPTWAYRILPG